MNASKPATRASSSRPRREGAGRRSRAHSPSDEDKRPQLASSKHKKKPSAARAKKPDPVRASQPDPFNARTRRRQGLTGTPARGNTPARKSQASARTRKCFEPVTVTRVLRACNAMSLTHRCVACVLGLHQAAYDSDGDTEPMSDADEAADALGNEEFRCSPVIKLILGGGAKKVASCPPAATLEVTLKYLRFCAFDDDRGISDISYDELLHTTVWELQSAAVSQLSMLWPHNELLKLWKEHLPSTQDIRDGDTLYLRRGPADSRLVTHLFVGIKGAMLEWVTSGQHLCRWMANIAAAAVAAGDSAPEFLFCLRAPPPLPPPPAVRPTIVEREQSGRGPGRPAAQPKRVSFELSVGTKQIGQLGAPKFMRTNDAVKQVVVDWEHVPGHTVSPVQSQFSSLQKFTVWQFTVCLPFLT